MQYFNNCYPNESVSLLVKKTSDVTATKKRSVHRIKKITKRRTFADHKKKSLKCSLKNNRVLKYDGFVIGTVRRIVESFFEKEKEKNSPQH